MDRRDAISRVGLILGGAVIGAEFFVSGCKSGGSVNTDDLFNADTTAYMDEIAETILPETSTPGAKAAKVGAFMAVMVRDCYTDDDQKIFKKGLKDLNDASSKKYNKSFMEADAKQRTELLTQLDKEAKDYNKNKKPEDPNHYFSMIKQLTLLGYFTSEPGATKALRYVPVPGKYIGDYPYKKGDKAWALS
ncbi:gluconate 2-dehydrogenase subunit 3 family protein [Mucilaginibacter achroorhodeus]|uniref:Gluconate 2-dehydrogenase subunit 3 family protein n=1 Tax=Mucilaginibacter achroorhodeus TaxID=2599294 RepID=A0A563U2J1_9SPHI|nr:gluconate 2-dehydrogenase subunit 3 family protein [Mucilaginibacter achroorhodeus]TWR25554.1 gluconate 2-dehydrogenase subunit 3 family protein [Mucilaginibacter achroorhodeus]